jgi:hypothetical protein
MPDGDRFERTLRRPWRLPYRLAAAGSPPERVAKKLSASCLGLLNADTVLCAQKMMAALDSALAHDAMPLFAGEQKGTTFGGLMRSLDRIAAEHHFDEMAQSCQRAVSRCFIGVENHLHVAETDLEQRFTRELMKEMVERHFFPKVRERVTENVDRDAASQRIWEGQVLDSIAEKAPNLARALFADDAHRNTKHRLRGAQSPPFDWNRLNEPLHVLGA